MPSVVISSCPTWCSSSGDSLGRITAPDDAEWDVAALVAEALRVHVRAGHLARRVDVREERDRRGVVVDGRRQRRGDVPVLVERGVLEAELLQLVERAGAAGRAASPCSDTSRSPRRTACRCGRSGGSARRRPRRAGRRGSCRCRWPWRERTRVVEDRAACRGSTSSCPSTTCASATSGVSAGHPRRRWRPRSGSRWRRMGSCARSFACAGCTVAGRFSAHCARSGSRRSSRSRRASCWEPPAGRGRRAAG